jgi:hypothetical protein
VEAMGMHMKTLVYDVLAVESVYDVVAVESL